MKKSFSSCRRRKDDEINRINCSCALRYLLQSMRRREREREYKQEKDNERREDKRRGERKRERAKGRENNFG